MMVRRHYKTERVSLGRILTFIGVYGIAIGIMGVIAVLLMLILTQLEMASTLRWIGFILIPSLFFLYLYAGYRIFRLFGEMFRDQQKGR